MNLIDQASKKIHSDRSARYVAPGRSLTWDEIQEMKDALTKVRDLYRIAGLTKEEMQAQVDNWFLGCG